MTDIMLDLETWGTRPGCAIRSIGACVFDPSGEGTGAEFYVNIFTGSCVKSGLTIDPNTEEWWSRQSKEAKEALLVNQQSLSDALWSFASWFQTMRGVRIWSHGANFDQPILDAAFVAAGFPGAPWSFWDSRCTRTLYATAGIDTRKFKRAGTHHNALDDAKFQALCVQKSMYRLFNTSTTDGVFS